MLLAVKTSLPPELTNTVVRCTAVQRLNQAPEGSLILMCAPAGYGKTTVLRSWLRGRENICAWVSLDEGDNDRERFWTYVIRSLQRIIPSIGSSALESMNSLFLSSADKSASELLLTPLLNDLFYQEFRAVLVLDDYHVIENRDIQQDMIFFIQRMPPSMKLAVTSRSEPPWPMHRWRARGMVVELRQRDLTFSLEEAEQFLTKVRDLPLTREQIRTLHEKTEGWVTGLLLASLSVSGSESAEVFISTFAGSSRHVLHFLTEEIFQMQDEQTRRFLLETSLLSQFCSSLCDAVTGRSDSSKVIERLERENMFITSLDDQKQWYRYHHLFSDLLSFHLERNSDASYRRELHERASAWFLESGEHSRALDHAVKSGNLESAAAVFDSSIEQMVQHEGPGFVVRYLDKFSEDLLKKFPNLLVNRAWLMLIHRGREETEVMLKYMDELPASMRTRDFEAMTSVVKACYHIYYHQIPQALEHAERALELLKPESMFWRTSLLIISGDIRLFSGSPAEAHLLYRRAYEETCTHGSTYLVISTGFKTAAALYFMGELKESEELVRKLLSDAKQQGFGGVSRTGLLWTLLGELLRQKGDLQEARQCMQRGLHISRTEIPSYAWNCLFAIFLARSMGDSSTASHYVDEVEKLHSRAGLPGFIIAPLYMQKSELLAASGRHDEALKILEGLGAGWDQPAPLGLFSSALSLCRISDAPMSKVSRLLDDVQKQAADGSNIRLFLEAQLLRARIERQKGSRSESLKYLKSAEQTARETGLYILFADEGFDTPEHDAGEEESSMIFAEQLSRREQEVLALIAEGCSNKQISQQLFVSTGTVKWHTSNIYGKLGVESRTEAAALAHRMNLV